MLMLHLPAVRTSAISGRALRSVVSALVRGTARVPGREAPRCQADVERSFLRIICCISEKFEVFDVYND